MAPAAGRQHPLCSKLKVAPCLGGSSVAEPADDPALVVAVAKFGECDPQFIDIVEAAHPQQLFLEGAEGADYTFPSPVNPVPMLDGERNPGREHMLARSRLVPGRARIMACAVPVDSNAGAQRQHAAEQRQGGSPPGRACRFTRSRKQRKRRHRRKNDGRQQCAGCLQRRSQHAQPQRESGKHGKSSENKRYGPHREDLAPVAPPGMDRQRCNHGQHNGGPGPERRKNRALILQSARNAAPHSP